MTSSYRGRVSLFSTPAYVGSDEVDVHEVRLCDDCDESLRRNRVRPRWSNGTSRDDCDYDVACENCGYVAAEHLVVIVEDIGDVARVPFADWLKEHGDDETLPRLRNMDIGATAFRATDRTRTHSWTLDMLTFPDFNLSWRDGETSDRQHSCLSDFLDSNKETLNKNDIAAIKALRSGQSHRIGVHFGTLEITRDIDTCVVSKIPAGFHLRMNEPNGHITIEPCLATLADGTERTVYDLIVIGIRTTHESLGEAVESAHTYAHAKAAL
jgi:hypothetical protein